MNPSNVSIYILVYGANSRDPHQQIEQSLVEAAKCSGCD